MKKILLLLMFVPILVFGQRKIERGSIITNVDTTVFITGFRCDNDWSIAFEYGTLDNDDWTLSIGHSDSWSFDKIDDSRVPYLLDITTNAYTDELGNARATVTFTGNGWRTLDLGIQIDVGTANADTLTYKYIQQ